MKKKTKLLALIFCLVLSFTSLQACGSADSNDKKDIITSENKGETGITDKNESESTVTIEEQVLFEQDGIVVTAKEYVTDRIWGDGIKLLIENNSDKDVTVGCSALIVNNYMISDLFVAGVAAGKKANEVMYLSSEELKAAGIDSVGQIEVYFHVYDTDTYDTLFDTEGIMLQTSANEYMDTTPNDVGMELYNADGIRIVGKTVDENSFWGTAILLYCENSSGKNISISVEEMSVNGFMMNPLFTTTIYDGKMAVEDITVFSSDLEENGIEKIEDVELKFHIYDAETYDTIADSDVITFSAE
ncbi:MAG: hypothetical protein IKW08_00775 [Roseburia sp.]|nr:hypothetical protein [Roseburia sp.]